MSKIFLTNEEIESDIQKAREMVASGEIVERTVPDVWCTGRSNLSRKTTILYAIFGGFFGLDRFYLKKPISACIKTFLILVVTLTMALLTYFLQDFYQNNILGKTGGDVKSLAAWYKQTLIVIIVFSCLFYPLTLGFYIADVIIAIRRPRDNEFHCVA